MKTPKSISKISDEILAEVEQGERVKTAEVEAIRAATPRYSTEIGELMHKVAEELRGAPADVTYTDLDSFLRDRR